MLNPSKIAVVLTALLITTHAKATTYYSRTAGNWNTNSTWSTVGYGGPAATSFPGQLAAGDIVYISGYVVTANITPSFAVGSLIISQANNTGSDTRLLVSGSNIILTCSGLAVSDNNINNHLDVEVASTARLQVNGSATITRSTTNARTKRMRLYIRNSAIVNVTGTLTYTFGRASGTHTDEEILIEDSGVLAVSGALSILHGYSAGSDNRFNISVKNSASLSAASVDATIANSNDGDDIAFDITGGAVAVNGTWTSTIASTATSSNSIDLNIDGATVTTGPMTILQNGGGSGDVDILINENSTSTPSSFTVNGAMTMTSNGGDDMEFEVNSNSTVNITGALTASLTTLSSGDQVVFDINGGTFTVGGAFTATAFDNNDVEVEIDAALMTVNGGITFTQDGASDGDMYIYVAENTNATATLSVAGTGITFNGSGGDDMDLKVYPGGNVVVTGNLTLNLADGSGNDRVRVLMENGTGAGPTMVINGHVQTSLTSGNSSSDQITFNIDQGSFTTTGNFTMTTAATVTGSPYSYIEIDGSSTVFTVGGALTLNRLGGSNTDYMDIGTNSGSPQVTAGSLVLNHQSGSETRFKATNESLVTINGNVTLQANAADKVLIDLNEDAVFSIGGNFIRAASPNRYGTLDASSQAWVKYIGSVQQTIAGDNGDGGDGFSYQNIEINNTGSVAPQLLMTSAEGDVTIPGSRTLSLVSGIIQSDITALFVIKNSATSSEGNAASFVDGPMKKIGNSPSSFVFPLGDGTKWARLQTSDYQYYSGTTEFTVQYRNMAPPNPGASALSTTGEQLLGVSSLEYWEVIDWDDPGDNARNMMTLYFESGPASGIYDPSGLRVAVLQPDNTWKSQGQGPVIYNNNGTVKVAGSTTDFGPVTFGTTTTGNPLPVELVEFGVAANGQTVEIKWLTASEVNCKSFVIERSQDGLQFEPLGSVNSTGTAQAGAAYSEVDYAPFVGVSYYRLRQIDHNGEFTLSDILSVEMVSTPTGNDLFSVFPNPATKADVHLTITPASETPFKVTLVDWSGKLIHSETINGGSHARLDVSDLDTGIYFISVVTDVKSGTLKLVKD